MSLINTPVEIYITTVPKIKLRAAYRFPQLTFCFSFTPDFEFLILYYPVNISSFFLITYLFFG